MRLSISDIDRGFPPSVFYLVVEEHPRDLKGRAPVVAWDVDMDRVAALVWLVQRPADFLICELHSFGNFTNGSINEYELYPSTIIQIATEWFVAGVG